METERGFQQVAGIIILFWFEEVLSVRALSPRIRDGTPGQVTSLGLTDGVNSRDREGNCAGFLAKCI